MKGLKSWIRSLFYRSVLFRSAVGVGSVALGRTESLGIAHLQSYVEEGAIGPLQRDEAMAFFGIIKTLRPKTVVEFGFFHGHSAFNFLCALSPDAHLYSYDVDDESAYRATTEMSYESRLTFIHKSQTNFTPSDIDNRIIDFVFFDAAHLLHLNTETFNKILPSLSPTAIIAIHDTGLWEKKYLTDQHHTHINAANSKWLTDDLCAHQPEERDFVEWIIANHPQFGAIHLHSTNTLRHGFSLIQRQYRLNN